MSATTAPPEVSRAGEPPGGASFDALYRATVDDLFAYAATLLRDRAAAEDVVAATFERAYRRRSSYRAAAPRRARRRRARAAGRARRGGRGAAEAHPPVAAAPAARSRPGARRRRGGARRGRGRGRHARLTASGERADRLRARLSTVTARVRTLERALRALRARTSYATVDLTVTEARRRAAAPATDGRWTPADALRDARRALELAAGVAIVALALPGPLALLGGAAALTGRTLRRRRREAALDVV